LTQLSAKKWITGDQWTKVVSIGTRNGSAVSAVNLGGGSHLPHTNGNSYIRPGRDQQSIFIGDKWAKTVIIGNPKAKTSLRGEVCVGKLCLPETKFEEVLRFALKQLEDSKKTHPVVKKPEDEKKKEGGKKHRKAYRARKGKEQQRRRRRARVQREEHEDHEEHQDHEKHEDHQDHEENEPPRRRRGFRRARMAARRAQLVSEEEH
jgi:hypothetical protein